MQKSWIFGYGSLMWKPGFQFEASEPALVVGLHRSLCVKSFVHRGTPEKPGLVLGLDRGGSCRGLAFRIAISKWDETIAYLRAREQVTMVYIERQVSVILASNQTAVEAITYVVDANHPQYAGHLGEVSVLHYVRQGHGEAGSCVDYVLQTAKHLRHMGFADTDLEALARQI